MQSGSLLLIPIKRDWYDFREVKHFRGLDSLVHDSTLSCVTCFDGLSSSPEFSALKASSRVMMRRCFRPIADCVDKARLLIRAEVPKPPLRSLWRLIDLIESVVNKHIDRDIDRGIIENIINEYDKLFEDIPYRFPNHIRQKVIKKFGGVKKLPNSLEIDYSNTIKKDYMNNMMSDVVINNV